MLRILVDAGHDPSNSSVGIIPDYVECNFVWRIAEAFISELNKYEGVEINRTRENKYVKMSNVDRGALVHKYKSDLFLSFHTNAIDKNQSKIDRPVIIPSVKCPMIDLANDFGEALVELFDYQLVKNNFKRLTQNYHQVFMKESNSQAGVDYYGVLYGCSWYNVPGIIIEHSFHSNKNVCEWFLKTPDSAELLGKCDAEVIAKYYGLKLKTEVDDKYHVGDIYLVKKGDKYTNGKACPDFVVGKSYTIKKVKDDYSAILLQEINSWIDISGDKPFYSVGGKYTTKSGDMYSNGKKVPVGYLGKTFTISQVKSDRILLKEINSWVLI